MAPAENPSIVLTVLLEANEEHPFLEGSPMPARSRKSSHVVDGTTPITKEREDRDYPLNHPLPLPLSFCNRSVRFAL